MTSVDLHHSSFAELEIEPGSVDLILTDPPYIPAAFDAVERFFLTAGGWLREGGALLAMVGQNQLPIIFAALARQDELTYHWTLAHHNGLGMNAQHFPLRLWIGWKPIIWATRGPVERRRWTRDVWESKRADKQHHRWGQPLDEFKHYVLTFSKRGDLVFDPFLGAGTTGVAAALTGRNFVGCDIDAAAVRRSQARIDAAIEYRKTEREKATSKA